MTTTNKTVSELTTASALTGAELFYADDGTNDVKVTADQIKDFTVGVLLLDEDDFASNSAIAAPTQQSTKAYVDNLTENIGYYANKAAVEAAIPQSSFVAIYIAEYAEDTAVGGAFYFPVAAEPSHDGKIQDASDRWWELDTSKGVDPKDFGAAADGITDDTAAINSALDYIRTQTATTQKVFKYFLDGKSRVYRIDGSLDATMINNNHGWGIRNLRLDAHCSDKVALDLTGSRFGFFQGVYIWGDQTDQPRSGIQVCRESAGASAGEHYFVSCQVDGYFVLTSFHNYASEINCHVHCEFWNRRATDVDGASFAIIMDGDGNTAIDGSGGATCISDFQTPATGARSFNSQLFSNCDFRKPSADGVAMYIGGCVGHEYRQCYWSAQNEAAVVIYFLTSGDSRDITLDGHFEGSGLTYIARFSGPSAAAKTMRGLFVRDHSPHPSTAAFGLDTITGITIYDLRVNIKTWDSGTPTLVSDETKFTIYDGDIILPTAASLGTVASYAALNARFFSLDGTVRTHYGSSTFAGTIVSTNTTQSTSDSTGAITTTGGLGVAKAANITGGLSVAGVISGNNTTNSTTTATGGIVTLGGIGSAKAATIGGILKTTDTTAATSTSTGSLQAAGGAGIAGALWIGGAVNFASAITYGGVTLSNAVTGTGNMVLSAGPTLTGTTSATSISAAGFVKSSSASGGVGYATGAGGAVTQLTSRTTSVTLNTICGAITLFSAAGSTTPAKFTVSNSSVSATDVICVNQKSGTDKYEIFVTNVSANSFDITFFTTGGTTTEQPVFNFAIIKAVAS